MMERCGSDHTQPHPPSFGGFLPQFLIALSNMSSPERYSPADLELQPVIARFHDLFGDMLDAAYLVETHSARILACNAAAEAQTGYPRDELIGKDLIKDLRVHDPDVPADAILENLAERRGLRIIDRKRRKDGSEYWDEILLIPFGSSEPSVHVSINRDITDRARREAALQESEKRHRTIFQSSSDAILVLSEDGLILEANPAACSMYGLSSDELIGARADALIHPDEGHRFSGFCEAVMQHGAVRARSVHRRRDGSSFDVEIHASLMPQPDSQSLLAVVRDTQAQVDAYRQLKSSRRKIEQLHEAATHLAQAKDEPTVYSLAVQSAQRILEFELCSLDTLEQDHLVVKAISTGLPPETSISISLDERCLATRTFLNHETIVFGSLEEVPDARPTNPDFKSGISAPIGSFGVFQVVSREADAFDAHDARLLELLLRHTAQAIERIRMQADLTRQANHDALTGVFNRRYFNQVIERELARSKRHERCIGFLMIDVNRFKETNDRYGHQVGDEVLTRVAAVMQRALRESDLVIRYGGDEFLVVLLESTESLDAAKCRLIAAVDTWNQTQSIVPFPVTLSVGTAQWHPQSELPIEAVLAQADRNMYAAKRQQDPGPSATEAGTPTSLG